MKSKILIALNYTEKDYNTLVMDAFVNWCAKRKYSNNHFQLLLTNNTLCKWYLHEYSKREKAFLHLAKPFIGKSSVADLRALYIDKTSQIIFYPKAIMLKILFTAKLNESKPIHSKPLRTLHTLN